MAETPLHILVDQNMPVEVADWLRAKRLHWKVQHVKQVGLDGKSDTVLYAWAQKHRAIILTFDEDFADARFYPLGHHHGVIRLRIWPTSSEEAKSGLTRLLEKIPDENLIGSLIIIDTNKIRIRHP